MHILALIDEGVGGVGKGDEIGGNHDAALVHQLVERVLAVGAGLAPKDLAGVARDGRAVPADVLAVGLHGELLQVGRETVQILRVGQHGVRVGAEEIDVPDVHEAHERDDVLLERRVLEVLIDGAEARQELLEALGPQQLVHILALIDEGVGGVGKGDEIGGNHDAALVHQLVERVLAVGAGLAPKDLAGVARDGRAVPADVLAVGLHGELLQVGRETVQILRVGQHGVRVGAEEIDVPDVHEAHERDDVLLERRVLEVLIDGAEARQELLEALGPQRKPARNCWKRSGPRAMMSDRPTAESTE